MVTLMGLILTCAGFTPEHFLHLYIELEKSLPLGQLRAEAGPDLDTKTTGHTAVTLTEE